MCLAKKITDKKNQMFVLSGILVFADKIIDARTAEQIKEVIRMTQVAQLLLEEGREEERTEGMKVLVDSLRAFAIPDEDIIGKLIEKYQLTKDEADKFIKQN